MDVKPGFEARAKVFLDQLFPSHPEKLFSLLRSLRSRVRRVRRHLAPVLTREKLTDDARKWGINQGDVIMVHSSLSKIGKVSGGPSTVVQALMDAVSSSGTILMPCYYSAEKVPSDLKQGIIPDLRILKSETGLITETFRTWPNVFRSSHPFSSVCAWGKHAQYVTRDHAIDPRICHPGSPLARLLGLGGKILGIGIDLGPVSFYHVIEDTWDGFPFEVYGETIDVTYLDVQGNRVDRPVSIYNRQIRETRIDQWGSVWMRSRLNEHLARKGILNSFHFGNAESWIIDAQVFYEELKRLANKGVTIYLTEEEWERRGEDVKSW